MRPQLLSETRGWRSVDEKLVLNIFIQQTYTSATTIYIHKALYGITPTERHAYCDSWSAINISSQ